MNANENKFCIVSGRTNPELVKKVTEHLGVEPVFYDTVNWPNGYPRCISAENVSFSGKKVIIIASLQYKDVGSPVEELELIVDHCRSAAEIHFILTYLCGKDDITHDYRATTNLAWICDRLKNLRPKSVNLLTTIILAILNYFIQSDAVVFIF